MDFAAVLKGELAGADLLSFVEDEVMPGHFHGAPASFISAEEFEERVSSAIKLFVWWFAVNGILRKTFRCFLRITLTPSFGERVHQDRELLIADFLRMRAGESKHHERSDHEWQDKRAPKIQPPVINGAHPLKQGFLLFWRCNRGNETCVFPGGVAYR